jgi:hypothetical protein
MNTGGEHAIRNGLQHMAGSERASKGMHHHDLPVQRRREARDVKLACVKMSVSEHNATERT